MISKQDFEPQKTEKRRDTIFDINEELLKNGLDHAKYTHCLSDIKDKASGKSDLDWAEIVQKYDLNIHPDTLRKASQTIFGGVFVSEFLEKESNNDPSSDTKILEDIRKEKQKLRDERSALNKILAMKGRREENIDTLIEAIDRVADEKFPEIETELSYTPGDNDLVVMLSDLHIGAEFDNVFGKYNSDIARIRMSKLAENVKHIAETHGSESCTIVLLGDLISGNIHKSISITNRENVIDQIKVVCDIVATFAASIASKFKDIRIYGIPGNHSRIDIKDDALLGERLDNLIPFIISGFLQNFKNITVYDEFVDETYTSFKVRGNRFVAVHGDYDSMDSTAIAKLTMWLQYFPYCVLMGHKHFPAYTDVSGVKVVQGGSLAGSGDDYTRQKRLDGDPNQTVLVCNNHGIVCTYNISL